MAKNRSRHDGSIYRRNDGRWCAAITLDGDGKRRRKVLYGANRKDVQEKLAKATRGIRKGIAVEATQQTVGEFLSRWLEEAARPRLRATSFDVYETVMRLHILPNLAPVQLAELSPVAIQTLYTQLESNGVTIRNRQHVHMILHKAFGQAVRWELIPRNPCDGVVIPKGTPRLINVLTVDEVIRFLEVAREDRLFALYALAIGSSARQGELFSLEWSQVDFNAGTISILRSLANVRGKKALGDVKSPSSRRKVELPRFALHALWEHRERMKAEGYDGSFVFVNKAHNLIDRGNFHAWSFKPLLKKTGLPTTVRFHDLRHTGISLLLSQGISLKVCSVRAGHATTTVTGTVYAHVLPGMGREAADRLDTLFSGLLSPVSEETKGQVAIPPSTTVQ